VETLTPDLRHDTDVERWPSMVMCRMKMNMRHRNAMGLALRDRPALRLHILGRHRAQCARSGRRAVEGEVVNLVGGRMNDAPCAKRPGARVTSRTAASTTESGVFQRSWKV